MKKEGEGNLLVYVIEEFSDMVFLDMVRFIGLNDVVDFIFFYLDFYWIFFCVGFFLWLDYFICVRDVFGSF